MRDLIDRKDLIEWIRNLEITNMARVSDGLKPKGLNTDGMLHMVFKMPSIEAVEVIRCKICDWYRSEERICVNPHCTQSFYGCRVQENHFCSYGERKENESNP